MRISIKINVKKDDIGMRLKINEPSQLFAVNLNSEHKCINAQSCTDEETKKNVSEIENDC